MYGMDMRENPRSGNELDSKLKEIKGMVFLLAVLFPTWMPLEIF